MNPILFMIGGWPGRAFCSPDAVPRTAASAGDDGVVGWARSGEPGLVPLMIWLGEAPAPGT